MSNNIFHIEQCAIDREYFLVYYKSLVGKNYVLAPLNDSGLSDLLGEDVYDMCDALKPGENLKVKIMAEVVREKTE